MSHATTDLCDAYADTLQIAEPMLGDFGGHEAFHGPITTVKVFEDNVLVRRALEEAGEGRVLVVDGGGSLRCALLGDRLAAMAADHGWAGVVVYGCIRDSAEIAGIPLGVKALTTHPMKSFKRGEGQRDTAVRFAGVSFEPGHYLYVDADGIVASHEAVAAP